MKKIIIFSHFRKEPMNFYADLLISCDREKKKEMIEN